MGKNLFFFVFYIFVIYKADGNCNFPTLKTPSSFCGRVTDGQFGINEFKRDRFVESVNTHRRYNAQNVTTVKWSERLAEIAQSWANGCTTSKIPEDCLPSSGYIVLHQLAYKGSEAEFPHQVVRSIWAKEKVINPPNKPEYKGVDKVGCGRVVASTGNYLVCLFAI